MADSSNVGASSTAQQPVIELQRLRSTSTRDRENTQMAQEDEIATSEEIHRVKWIPLLSLVGQHFSSSWGERSYEFASYLYLIVLFPDSLIPASLLGFAVTVTGVALSGRVGRLVDEHKRLPFVRTFIALQKILQLITYGLFLVLFRPLRPSIDDFGKQPKSPAVYLLLALIIVSSSVMGLATAGINVAIQRDWVVAISQGSHTLLTRLNTYLRRVDLVCKLLAPLLVSLLTTTISYSGAVTFYLIYAAVTLAVEQLWIRVVWNYFEVLATDEKSKWEKRREERVERSPPKRFLEGLYQQGKDLKEFFALPIFLSSLSM
ncbi:hypothetical protein FRB91_010285 [Serendipita sp. 411]|nr:hypothetical protein FRB91_010285 [Serendipita sp. 411]KAG9053372.1 hypothetical protein FS842_008285 [Serendipita sp. 407]